MARLELWMKRGQSLATRDAEGLTARRRTWLRNDAVTGIEVALEGEARGRNGGWLSGVAVLFMVPV